jgi:hypothetical protein
MALPGVADVVNLSPGAMPAPVSSTCGRKAGASPGAFGPGCGLGAAISVRTVNGPPGAIASIAFRNRLISGLLQLILVAVDRIARGNSPFRRSFTVSGSGFFVALGPEFAGYRQSPADPWPVRE